MPFGNDHKENYYTVTINKSKTCDVNEIVFIIPKLSHFSKFDSTDAVLHLK